MLLNLRAILFGLAAVAVACSSLRADFVMTARPNATYLSRSTLLDFTDPDFTLVGAVSGSGETLTYDNTLEEFTVPGTWNTWNHPPVVETATPRVGDTAGDSLTITLSRPASTFGFELEPDSLTTDEVTAAFFSGSTPVGTIDAFPNGNAGALLYAASSSTNPFTSVLITDLAGNDFAIARQRFTLATPEPAPLILVGSILLAGCYWLRVRRRARRFL